MKRGPSAFFLFTIQNYKTFNKVDDGVYRECFDESRVILLRKKVDYAQK